MPFLAWIRCPTPSAQNRPVPRNNTRTEQSPDFAPEWEPAMDRENQGFLNYQCFAAVPQTHSVQFQALDYSHRNETVLPKPGLSSVAIANGWY